MTPITLRTDFSPESFSPFGAVIQPPSGAGARALYSEWLGSAHPGTGPVFHTNLNTPVSLPHTVGRLEKHPHAAQAFVPLDVSRYLVMVAPSDPAGDPQVEEAQAFLVPGDLGVIYRADTWHAGASVLDRPGSFAVLMWRGAPDDDVFCEVEPISLLAPGPAMAEAS